MGESLSGTHHVYNSFSSGNVFANASNNLYVGYITGSIRGFSHNCYANADLVIRKNGEVETPSTQSLIYLSQTEIIEDISSKWDNSIWSIKDKKSPTLIAFNDIQLIKINSNGNEGWTDLQIGLLVCGITIILIIFGTIFYKFLKKKGYIINDLWRR